MMNDSAWTGSSEQYERYRSLDRQPIQYLVQYLVDTLPAWGEVTVCELGCGSGRYLVALVSALRHAGHEVITACGIDSDGRAVRDASRHHADPGFIWRTARSSDTGIRRSSLDIVIAFNCIHLIPVRETLGEVHRILRPGARLAIYTRLREHESQHLWGRYFPGYLHRTINPTRDAMMGLTRQDKRFRLAHTREFEFTRIVSLDSVTERTRLKHYSTLRRYDDQEFAAAYVDFVDNLVAHHEDPDRIVYPSKYSLFIYWIEREGE